MDLLKDIWSKYSSEVFNEDYCDEVLGYIDQLRDNLNIYIDYYIDKRETNHSETVDSLKNTIENKNNEEKCLKFLRELKYSLLSLLNTLKLDIRREYFNINRKLVDISTGGRIDIFSAIRLGDYNRFLQCFNDGEGVNIGQTDKDGYTPITFAAKEGNNQMVQFFIDNDIDLSVCDKRGYNAFETAVINHYQDICDLILSKDSSIINLCDKSLDELASMNTFNKWIKMHQK
jgi:ankyrin repeat protein